MWPRFLTDYMFTGIWCWHWQVSEPWVWWRQIMHCIIINVKPANCIAISSFLRHVVSRDFIVKKSEHVIGSVATLPGTKKSLVSEFFISFCITSKKKTSACELQKCGMWVTSRLLCGGSSGLTGLTHFQPWVSSQFGILYTSIPPNYSIKFNGEREDSNWYKSNWLKYVNKCNFKGERGRKKRKRSKETKD